MINKSTRSILHGLTNGTDSERRPEADDLGIDDGRARRLPSLPPDTSIRSKYRAFSSAVEALEEDKRRQMTTVCVARPTAPRLLQEAWAPEGRVRTCYLSTSWTRHHHGGSSTC
ncbi:hypothetical protein M3591_02030 [Exiguobacterium sp. MER 193]|uniref:hypothetical protein n=1 Tax=Exiguobacterium sp. MER 193 TaxID=2939564 RepID=UPI00203D9E98|nr:hypothetical protein [Exiguobacterium sp. MER 193]MCM3279308.1 hypothetical protein [Exiguobacterium sp. MER 193]